MRWPGVSAPIDDCGGTYVYDHAAAQKAVDFFPTFLKHSAGEYAGQPFELEDWQRDLIVAPLFGWKHAKTGLRRFRKVYIEIPKKNGKTQLDAGLGLFVLYCDNEPAAEVYVAAADREQAAILFDAAKAMVEDAPDLSGMSEIYRRSIVFTRTRSSFKVVSADARTKHGPNIHCIIIDELHAQPSRDLFDTLTKGVAARRQPLTILLTTAGEDPESICREEHDYAANVISGVFDDQTLLPVIFAAAEKDDWREPAVWAKANPNLGKTVKPSFLETECRAAQLEPRKQNSFKRLHLNIWTDQHNVWIPLEEWDACKGELGTNATPVATAAGMDLSSKLDLTAFVVVQKFKDDRPTTAIDVMVLDEDDEDAPPERRTLNIDFRIEVSPYFYLPAETLPEREKSDRVPYSDWLKQDLLRVTPGAIVDYDVIYRDVLHEIAPKFQLKGGEIGYDPYNATQFATQLRDKAGFTVVEVPQTVRVLSEPAKLFEALVHSGRVTHDGHRLLRWNVANVAVREDKNGNIFPFKPFVRKRIDGVSAILDALSRLIVMPDKRAKRRAPLRWTPNGFVPADGSNAPQVHA